MNINLGNVRVTGLTTNRLGKQIKYILVPEEIEKNDFRFIFREIDNPQYGHSGHHATPKEAIQRFMHFTGLNPEINFYFDGIPTLVLNKENI